YAQATAPILESAWPDTHLTVGIRYTSEDRGLTFVQVPTPAGYPVSRSTDYSNTSYRLALDHQFDDDRMIYASYTTGFKSGLYNTNAPLDPPVNPETVKAYEAGFKSKWLDRRLLLDVAVFHYTFDDIQLRKPTGAAGGTTSLLNAAAGRSEGVNVSVQAVVTEKLTFQTGFEILSTRYTRFPNAPISFLAPASCTPSPGGSTGSPTGGTVACVGDATGDKLIEAPPFSANVGAQYNIPLSTGDLRLSVQYSYTDQFYWEADNRLKNPAHSLVNAVARWVAPGGRWELALWGKNLGDAKYLVNAGSLPFGDIATDAPPRTYGVDLKFRYGG
ncbi:MAG: hypothetical protein JWQ52_81, partial [Phenylobacterium sp.]|nr:hypothetical protein [Phenylobacterium sp.]